MTIREKLQEQLGILSKEKERRKKKRLSTSGGELNLNQVGDQFIGGNSVFAQDEDFRHQVEENAMKAMSGENPTQR